MRTGRYVSGEGWVDYPAHQQLIVKIIEDALQSHTREMEGYSYFGSNPGVPEDMYDEVADDIIEKLEEVGIL